MPAMYATAPAKTILLGEHAVVYGMPAIAIPVNDLKSKAILQALPLASPGTVLIKAPDIALYSQLNQLPDNHPIAAAIHLVLDHYGLASSPACLLTITSPIPIGSGLGSSASVTVAILKAYSSFLGQPLPPDVVSDLAFKVEEIYHGSPSGIDNTVISHEKPIYYVKGHPAEFLSAPIKFSFLIGDTGISRKTADAVGMVRKAWEANPDDYNQIFHQIGEIVMAARAAMTQGDRILLGQLLITNQVHLSKMGLSAPKLDALIEVSLQAGALGAKLSGAGLGGNMIALVDENTSSTVEQALRSAGAFSVFHAHIGCPEVRN